MREPAAQDVPDQDQYSGTTRRRFITGALALAAPTMMLTDVADGAAPAQVDLLILGPDIVTFDDLSTVIAGGAIAVKGNAIVWMGKEGDA
ncbi:MAG: hypothetical protein ABSF96_05580, partial [Steroidobacteraceae bacterium]